MSFDKTSFNIHLRFFSLVFAMSGIVYSPVSFSIDIGAENLGELSLERLDLMVEAESQEQSRGGIDLRQSQIDFRWNYFQQFEAHLAFGSSDWVQPPIWYTDESSQMSMIRAEMQVRSEFGQFHAGLLPVSFEIPGVYRRFPQTLVEEERWLHHNDYGLKYSTNYRYFRASWAVHNGEVGPNADGRVWHTFNWVFSDLGGTFFSLRAATGDSRDVSTLNSQAGVGLRPFLFDPALNAKFRQVSFHLSNTWWRHHFGIEAGRGEILQSVSDQPRTSAHGWGFAAIAWRLKEGLYFLNRYELTQNQLNQGWTRQSRAGIGLSWDLQQKLGLLSLFASHSQEEPAEPNDAIHLVYRLGSIPLFD